jgi:hypothetical protein
MDSQFLNLPDIAFSKIAVLLSTFETSNLQSACRFLRDNAVPFFWVPKFDTLPEDTPRPGLDSSLKIWFSEYIKWQQRALGICSSDLCGAWLNDERYWKRNVPESSSPYGVVLELTQVCWLDFGGSILCQPGGTYIVALRCKVGDLHSALHELELRVVGHIVAPHVRMWCCCSWCIACNDQALCILAPIGSKAFPVARLDSPLKL